MFTNTLQDYKHVGKIINSFALFSSQSNCMHGTCVRMYVYQSAEKLLKAMYLLYIRRVSLSIQTDLNACLQLHYLTLHNHMQVHCIILFLYSG